MQQACMHQVIHVHAIDVSTNRLSDHLKWRYVWQKAGIYVIGYNVIWANQKTESYVYRWLRALALFNVTRFSAFVGESDVISSILSVNIHKLYLMF